MISRVHLVYCLTMLCDISAVSCLVLDFLAEDRLLIECGDSSVRMALQRKETPLSFLDKPEMSYVTGC